jgi:S1-C subfamily serine protease
MDIERPDKVAVMLDEGSGKRAASEPVSFPGSNEPFIYVKTAIAIRNGTTIFSMPPNVEGVDAFCNAVNFRTDHKSVWTGSSGVLGGWQSDTGVIFYDVMTSAGYEMAGNPDQLFEVNEDTSRSRYQVAGRIDRMRGNLCQQHSWWDARPLGNYAGELSMSVTWAVLDTLSQETVYQTQTEGYFQTGELSQDGINRIILGAFADAAGVLAGDSGFRDLVAERDQSAVAAAAEPLSDEPIFLPKLPESAQRFQDVSAERIAAAVTIRSGNSHGSGVVVSSNGYILTNEHVVDRAEQVTVIFAIGIEVVGNVLRFHKARDVAVVKVPMNGLPASPITAQEPRIGEDVFVVGTPVDTAFSSTVTRGIFGGSKRMVGISGPAMDWIRHDAATIGGNSGGAIYDAQGNVIGLISWGARGQESLNFGVPIMSGLSYLNIQLQGTAGG